MERGDPDRSLRRVSTLRRSVVIAGDAIPSLPIESLRLLAEAHAHEMVEQEARNAIALEESILETIDHHRADLPRALGARKQMALGRMYYHSLLSAGSVEQRAARALLRRDTDLAGPEQRERRDRRAPLTTATIISRVMRRDADLEFDLPPELRAGSGPLPADRGAAEAARAAQRVQLEEESVAEPSGLLKHLRRVDRAAVADKDTTSILGEDADAALAGAQRATGPLQRRSSFHNVRSVMTDDTRHDMFQRGAVIGSVSQYAHRKKGASFGIEPRFSSRLGSAEHEAERCGTDLLSQSVAHVDKGIIAGQSPHVATYAAVPHIVFARAGKRPRREDTRFGLLSDPGPGSYDTAAGERVLAGRQEPVDIDMSLASPRGDVFAPPHTRAAYATAAAVSASTAASAAMAALTARGGLLSLDPAVTGVTRPVDLELARAVRLACEVQAAKSARAAQLVTTMGGNRELYRGPGAYNPRESAVRPAARMHSFAHAPGRSGHVPGGGAAPTMIAGGDGGGIGPGGGSVAAAEEAVALGHGVRGVEVKGGETPGPGTYRLHTQIPGSVWSTGPLTHAPAMYQSPDVPLPHEASPGPGAYFRLGPSSQFGRVAGQSGADAAPGPVTMGRSVRFSELSVRRQQRYGSQAGGVALVVGAAAGSARLGTQRGGAARAIADIAALEDRLRSGALAPGQAPIGPGGGASSASSLTTSSSGVGGSNAGVGASQRRRSMVDVDGSRRGSFEAVNAAAAADAGDGAGSGRDGGPDAGAVEDSQTGPTRRVPLVQFTVMEGGVTVIRAVPAEG